VSKNGSLHREPLSPIESKISSIFNIGGMNACFTQRTTKRIGDSSDLDTGYIPYGVKTMPREEHSKAAEHHENAAKSHRNAADSHGRGEHDKGFEQSTQAHEHSTRAHQSSSDAHERSRMSRSEAGSKGGKSLSHEEHARAGSQSQKNDNR
jgi:hypothetical protein